MEYLEYLEVTFKMIGRILEKFSKRIDPWNLRSVGACCRWWWTPCCRCGTWTAVRRSGLTCDGRANWRCSAVWHRCYKCANGRSGCAGECVRWTHAASPSWARTPGRSTRLSFRPVCRWGRDGQLDWGKLDRCVRSRQVKISEFRKKINCRSFRVCECILTIFIIARRFW